MGSSFGVVVDKWPRETPFRALDYEGNMGPSLGQKGPRPREGPLVLTVTRDLKVELIKCRRFTARSFTG